MKRCSKSIPPLRFGHGKARAVMHSCTTQSSLFMTQFFKARKYKKYIHVAGFLYFSSSSITTHKSQITTHKSQLTNHNSQITTHKSLPTTHHSQPTKKAVNPAGSQSRFFTFPTKFFQNKSGKQPKRQLFPSTKQPNHNFKGQLHN